MLVVLLHFLLANPKNAIAYACIFEKLASSHTNFEEARLVRGRQ